ncbi:MAG: ParA family protein [Pseudomonadota bacterium]
MSKIIAITSQRGGVGKTSTCLNLGVSLAKTGKKVLLIDTDPQGALAIACNLTRITKKGLTQLLRGEVTEDDIVIQAGKRSLFFVGAGVETPQDVFFLKQECSNGHLGMAIRGLATGYDYILLDTRTGLDNALLQLLVHADSILLPCPCQVSAIKTLPLLLKGIQKIQSEQNPRLTIEGILLTLTEDKDPCALEIRQEIERAFPAGIFFTATIPFLRSFEQAALHAVPVALLKNAPAASQAFDALAEELDARTDSREE